MNSMNVKWLVEEGYFWDKNLDTLTPVLKKLGIEYKFVDCLKLKEIAANRRNLVDCLYPKNTPYVYEDSDCVIAYGSIEFIDALRKAPFIPCCWNNYENLKCSTYMSFWGNYLLNKWYIMLPLNEVKRNIKIVKNLFGEKFFIRPDSGKKEFTGCVVSCDNFDQDLIKMSYGLLEPNWLCLIADTKKIKAEWRFVIADKKVIGGCRYKLNEQHDEEIGYPKEALELAEKIASDSKWQPCKVYSLDIGSYDTDDGEEYGLIEINGFNTAGMYLCDWNVMVPALNEIALKEWGEVWSEDNEDSGK